MILATAIFLTILKIIIGHEIEYYPSQSLLNAGSDISVNRHKRDYNQLSDIKDDIKWRKFDKGDQIEDESNIYKNTSKRATDPVFHGFPKTREELWHERFLNESNTFDQTPSLIKLLHNITLTYLKDCTPVLLYDNQVKSKESYLFQNLLKDFPVSFVHGFINDKDKLQQPELLVPVKECLHFIIFLHDVKVSAKILGKQSESKVVLVARSSQWAVQEFLASSQSRYFVNLLVIGQSFKEGDDTLLVRFTYK